MTPRILFLATLVLPPTLWAGRPVEDLPFTTLDAPIGFELSPLSPSATRIPLPTAENTFVNQVEDLSGRAPNFFVSSTARHSLGDVYSVRGLTNGRLLTEPSVGLYVDGVPAGSAFTYAEPLYSIDHVDLFRSAQPTLFGLGAEGGILNIETRHADPQAWHGELSALYARFDTLEHRVWLGGPLIAGKLTLELAGFKGTSNGFIDNRTVGGHRDDRDTASARAVLTWTPLADWEITAGYEGTRAHDGSSRFTLAGSDRFQSFSDEPGRLNLNNQREWLSIRKSFETWQIRSVTSHNSWTVNPAVQDDDLTSAGTARQTVLSASFSTLSPVTPDLGTVVFPPLNGETSQLRLHEEVWSEEVRLSSLPTGSREDPWWTAGAFFQSKRTTGSEDVTGVFSRLDTTFIPLPATVFGFPPVLGFPGFSFDIPNFASQDRLTTIPITRHDRFSQLAETWAAYGSVGRRWGAWEIAGGLRATYTHKEFHRELNDPAVSFPDDFVSLEAALAQAQQASMLLPPGTTGAPINLSSNPKITRTTTRYSASDDDFNVTPSVGTTFDLTKNVQLFAHSTYIVKPGGYSPLTAEDVIHYGREQVWSTEAGARASALQGRVSAQLTGYVNEIKGYQRPLATGPERIADAGRARAVGAEFEAAAHLLPGLAVSGNFGCNQTELTQAAPGRQAPFVPRYTAFAAIDYAHETGFRAHLEYLAIGDTDYISTNLTADRQGAYGLVNGRIGFERGHYGAYLFVRNLTDTQRYTQRTLTPDAASTGEPRVVGVMAMVKF